MKQYSIARQIKINKLQNKNRMTGKTFNVLGNNERRIRPWLGSCWYEPGMDEKRAERVKEWQEETKKLLKINPNLKLVK